VKKAARFNGSNYLANICLLVSCLVALVAQAEQPTTAWNAGMFHVDAAGVVGRSDIILLQPNKAPHAAMPLGNGRLGLAVWAADGYTAQLNRGDTFPARLSPGQIIVPGLQSMTRAKDYSARLNLYDGQFEEQGGGMSAVTYVDASLDAVVIHVEGADPATLQTAELMLWPPRHPQVLVTKKLGVLAETWKDDKEAGASGETFGSLAAITADALDLRVEQSGEQSVLLTFRPHPDGSFSIFVGSPAWRGKNVSGDAAGTAAELLAAAQRLSTGEHRAWWHQYWSHIGLMKLHSPGHAAEYVENLRMIDLFTAAAEGRGRFPGGQAGVGDLFSAFGDYHQWSPSAYWHWNLRMQTDANLGAGAPELNDPYFRLYRENLANILAWTRRHMGGRSGVCVPETMRFNGPGYENETWLPKPAKDCAEDSPPYFNARTLSTGAEVSFWIWQQYLFTDDLKFLQRNYPVMRESARFLLAYARRGSDGKLETFPSNAHETQWDVHDPTTDIAAMRTLFAEVSEAAKLLNTDAALALKCRQTLAELPAWPLVGISSPGTLLDGGNSSDAILAASYDPKATIHNSENIGLEPVWPYGLIGDGGPLHALGVRTFLHRPNKDQNDWSFDPLQAARLGLADELRSSLLTLTRKYQVYPSGMAGFAGGPEFYVEQIGVVAAALQNALVQDYDGLLRIAPAWPADWDADATVSIRHRSKVCVQIRSGQIITVGIESGANGTLRLRNPWPSQSVEVINARTGAAVLPASSASILKFPARVSTAYLVRRTIEAKKIFLFQAISGTGASAPKNLGARMIGMDPMQPER